MKKYLLLLAAFGLIFFSSCSDDDDAGDKEHSIVASWNLTSVSPQIPGWDVMACEQNPAITFEQNGTADWTLYDAENECAAVNDSGTWEKKEDNIYTVSIPQFGEVDGVVAFSGENKFTFTTSVPDLPFQVVLTFQK